MVAMLVLVHGHRNGRRATPEVLGALLCSMLKGSELLRYAGLRENLAVSSPQEVQHRIVTPFRPALVAERGKVEGEVRP
jgi:hypothetical protein